VIGRDFVHIAFNLIHVLMGRMPPTENAAEEIYEMTKGRGSVHLIRGESMNRLDADGPVWLGRWTVIETPPGLRVMAGILASRRLCCQPLPLLASMDRASALMAANGAIQEGFRSRFLGKRAPRSPPQLDWKGNT
jgi:hypothetical protein